MRSHLLGIVYVTVCLVAMCLWVTGIFAAILVLLALVGAVL